MRKGDVSLYKVMRNVYAFPFTCMHERYGRIEWCVELIRAKKQDESRNYPIKKLLLWTRQSDDERYDGKLFTIPCHAESLAGAMRSSRTAYGSAYLSHVYCMSFCEVHKNLVMFAYPDNQHNRLIIDADSSIMLRIEFVVE